MYTDIIQIFDYSMTAHKRTGSAESIRSGHPLDEEHKGRMSFSYDADHSDNDGNLLYLSKRIFIVITINSFLIKRLLIFQELNVS